jgi:hypothetical protein
MVCDRPNWFGALLSEEQIILDLVLPAFKAETEFSLLCRLNRFQEVVFDRLRLCRREYSCLSSLSLVAPRSADFALEATLILWGVFVGHPLPT